VVFSEPPDEIWVKINEKEEEKMEFAENVRFKSYAKTNWPIADPGTSWNPDAAKKRLVDKGGWKLLSQCCGAVEFHGDEKELPEAFSRYKFPFCDVIDGKVQIVPKAVSSGIGYLNGARGVKVDPSLAKVVKPILEKLKNRIEKSKAKEAGEMERNEFNNEQYERFQREIEALRSKVEEYEKMIRQQRAQELINLAEGKVPKKKLGLIKLLTEVLPFEKDLEFAEEDGSVRKLTVFELLKEIFSAIPKPVEPGSLVSFGDEEDERDPEVSHLEVLDRI
jgi:hypothetical protein